MLSKFFSFLAQNLNLTSLDRKLEILLERDYIKIIRDSCAPHKFTEFMHIQENVIDVSQSHATYQKADNML